MTEKPKVIHVPDYGRGLTLCGIVVQPDQLSRRAAVVTCKRCLRQCATWPEATRQQPASEVGR